MNDNDYLGEYMAECPKCHHRYNKNLHGNKCPDCGHRDSNFLKALPFIIVALFLMLVIFPNTDTNLELLLKSDKLRYFVSRVSLLNPVYALIGINIILYFFGWNSDNVEKYGNCYNDTIRRGQIHRLLTSGFAHADILHILCNMWSLYNLGLFAYSKLGFILFLMLYFVSLIIGGLLSIVIHHLNGNDEAYSVGASGAICGLLGFYAIFIYKSGLHPSVLAEAMYTALAPLAITMFNPRIDNIGHLCGLAVGIVFSILLTTNMNIVNVISVSNGATSTDTKFVAGETINVCYVEFEKDGIVMDSIYVENVEDLNNVVNEYLKNIENKVQQNELMLFMNGTINTRLSQNIKYTNNVSVLKNETIVFDKEELSNYLLENSYLIETITECDVTDGTANYKFIFINGEFQSANVQ